MAYASWSVVFGEQPSAAKWNILGTNDASFNDGTGLPNGVVLQVVSTLSTAAATGTTTIPLDNTIPQITEGDQYMTLAITPKSTTNKLVIFVTAMLSSSASSQHLIGALFQDSTANALAASATREATASAEHSLSFNHTMTAGTTSSTTFRFRAGGSGAGTTSFNAGVGVSPLFGATTKSSIVIYEYKA